MCPPIDLVTNSRCAVHPPIPFSLFRRLPEACHLQLIVERVFTHEHADSGRMFVSGSECLCLPVTGSGTVPEPTEDRHGKTCATAPL